MEERYCCPTCRAVFRAGFARCPLDGASLQPLAGDPLAGSTFADRYVVEECIGEGAMGRVYRARHARMSRQFAIKVLFGDHAADPKMQSRFAREAEAASRLSHPNVISVVDFGETPDRLLYLVMDFVEGPALAEIIATEGPMDERRAVNLARQLCLGLAHAHDKGLVHRDFKAENVIVAADEREETPRIVDFGIAVLREGEESGGRITTDGMVVGTPAYMAPEQATDEGLDHRADLFSLGVVFYEMLAGVLPFSGSPIMIARQNLTADPPRIGERVPGIDVHPRLEGIIFKLMAKAPGERYQSALEVVDALDAFVAGPTETGTAQTARHEVVSRPQAQVIAAAEVAGTTEQVARGGVRRRRAVALAAAAVVVAAAVAGLFLFRNGVHRAAPGAARPAAVPGSAGAAAAAAGERGAQAPAAPRATPAVAASAPAPAGSAPADAAPAAATAPLGRSPGPSGAAGAAARSAAAADRHERRPGGRAHRSRRRSSAGRRARKRRSREAARLRRTAAAGAGSRKHSAAAAGAQGSGAGAMSAGGAGVGPHPRGRKTSSTGAGAAAAATVPTVAAFSGLYQSVGAALQRLTSQRGGAAAASLRRRYFSIPFADALRDRSLRRDAARKLRRIQRDIDRARHR